MLVTWVVQIYPKSVLSLVCPQCPSPVLLAVCSVQTYHLSLGDLPPLHHTSTRRLTDGWLSLLGISWESLLNMQTCRDMSKRPLSPCNRNQFLLKEWEVSWCLSCSSESKITVIYCVVTAVKWKRKMHLSLLPFAKGYERYCEVSSLLGSS